MIRMSGGNRRSLRRRNYLPYQVSRQFQRDIMVGFAMIVSCGILLLILGAATDPFTVRLLEEGPQYVAQTSDGETCQIFETRPLDDPAGEVRAMVDCGDRPGPGVVGVFQYLFLAISGVGVLLVASGGFALVVSTYMRREMLVVPVAVLGIIIGIVAVSSGLAQDGPGLVFQGLRSQATTGVLRPGGPLSSGDGAVAWGVGLISASVFRLTRS